MEKVFLKLLSRRISLTVFHNNNIINCCFYLHPRVSSQLRRAVLLNSSIIKFFRKHLIENLLVLDLQLVSPQIFSK